MDGLQQQPPPFRFALPPAFFRRFQSMVDGVAQQMHQRIVQGVDDRFVEFRFLAGEGEVHCFAEIPPEIMHQPAEAPEQGADGQQPQAHGEIAQPGGQAPDFLAHGFQGLVYLCALGQSGLGDHQFSHLVHQAVEALWGHADAGGWRCGAGDVGADMMLFGQGGLHPVGGDLSLLHQPGAHPIVLFQGGGEGGGRHIAPFHQDFAEPPVWGFVEPLDDEFRLVGDEQEHVLDRAPRGGGGEEDVPGEMTDVGVEVLQRRHLIGEGHHCAGAQGAQFFQKTQGVGAQAHDLGSGAEADAEGAGLGLFWCGGRRGGRSLARAAGHGAKGARQGFAPHGIGGGGGFQQRLDVIEGPQGDGDQFGREDQAPAAHALEGVFDLMDEGGEGLEAEHAA